MNYALAALSAILLILAFPRFDLVWLAGWAPHDSQQKPLKPGSAKMRLEDALRGQGKGGG